MTGQTQKGQLPNESVLVCSSALLGQPGCSGATEHLRDCITGVATLLDDSPMESDNRNGQFCEKQTLNL